MWSSVLLGLATSAVPQIDENKKLCRNSYNKKYLDYICVDSLGKLFRPEYVTDHFTLIMNKNKDTLRKNLTEYLTN